VKTLGGRKAAISRKRLLLGSQGVRAWQVFDGLTSRWMYGQYSQVEARTFASKLNRELALRGEHPRDRYSARSSAEVGEWDPWQFGRGPSFSEAYAA
jgi:hypothetical protein